METEKQLFNFDDSSYEDEPFVLPAENEITQSNAISFDTAFDLNNNTESNVKNSSKADKVSFDTNRNVVHIIEKQGNVVMGIFGEDLVKKEKGIDFSIEIGEFTDLLEESKKNNNSIVKDKGITDKKQLEVENIKVINEIKDKGITDKKQLEVENLKNNSEIKDKGITDKKQQEIENLKNNNEIKELMIKKQIPQKIQFVEASENELTNKLAEILKRMQIEEENKRSGEDLKEIKSESLENESNKNDSIDGSNKNYSINTSNKNDSIDGSKNVLITKLFTVKNNPFILADKDKKV